MAQVKERGIYNFATPRRWHVSLSWHLRNELECRGCLDLQPCYDLRRFSVVRWMYPDGGDNGCLDDPQEPVRYSELDEFEPESWEARMHPWEDDQKGCAGIGFFGYSEKRAEDYVDRRLYGVIESRKYDRVGVAYKPFGGKPMICGVKEGKITIL